MLANAHAFHGDHHPVEVYEGRESRNLGQVKNGYINPSGGYIVSDGNYRTVEAVLPPGTYTFSTDMNSPYIPRVWFDSAEKTVFGYSNKYTVTTTTYGDVKCTFRNATTTTIEGTAKFMLNEGTEPLPYEPFGVYVSPLYLPAEVTASGTALGFEGTYNDAAEVSVAGRSEQASYTGKNLLNIHRSEVINRTQPDGTGYGYTRTDLRPFNDNQVWLGMSMNNYFYSGNIITADINEDSVTVESKQSGYGVAYPVRVAPDTKYILSFENNSEIDANSFGIGFFDETGAIISWAQTKTFTVPSNAVWATIVMRPQADTEVTFKKPQLEAGTAATPYEPYVGGIPSPNPDYPQTIESVEAVTLESGGRNLLDDSAMTGRAAATNGGTCSDVEVVGTRIKCRLEAVNAGWTNVQLGMGTIDLSYLAGRRLRVVIGHNVATASIGFSVDGTFANRSNGAVFTASKTIRASQMYVAVNQPGTYDVDAWFMLIDADSTVPTEFEPYRHTTFDIDLQGNQLRSLPDGTMDELVLTRSGKRWIDKGVWEYEYDPTDKWAATTYNGRKFFYNQSTAHPLSNKTSAGRVDGNLLCTAFREESVLSMINGMVESGVAIGSGYFGGASMLQLGIYDSRCGTKEEYMSMLAEVRPKFYYRIADRIRVDLQDGEPLPTFWPYTHIYANGEDITAQVRVIED